MKKRKTLLAVSILLLTALACNVVSPQAESPAPPAQSQNNTILQSEDEAPRISVQESKAALDAAQAVIVDVRSAESYAANHVAGAISIPLQNFENNINNLSLEKDQWIITYCT